MPKIIVAVFVLIAATVAHAQEAARVIPQANSSFVDADGTAHITRVVPLSPALSPEARKWLSAQIPDTDPKFTVEQLRTFAAATQERMTAAAKTASLASVAEDTIGGIPVKIVTPAAIPPSKKDRVLICLHGGGFVADWGSATEAIPIASLTRTKVISVLYRLAPEHPFPAALDDSVAVYQELLKTYRPQNIGIYGTSAGAALTVEVAAKLKQKKLPMPAALGVFSGWGDFARATDSVAMYGLTGLSGPAAPQCSACSVASYVGSLDPRDPNLSPFFADLSGLPPTLFLTSTRDLVLSGTTMLHRQFLKAGVPAELIVFEGLPHAFWVAGPANMPETIEANRVIAEFLDRQLGREAAHRAK